MTGTEEFAVTGTASGFDPEAEAGALAAALRELGAPERAEGAKRYLKSDLAFLGTTVAAVRQAATSLRRRWPRLPRDDLLALVDRLWSRDVFELRLAAVELLQGYHDRLSPAELEPLETLLRDCRTWALVDPLAIKVAGELVVRHPDAAVALDRWAVDGDFWLRRSALLALIPGVRDGHPDLARLDRYGETMLTEKEFFIRKAIGWVLRELVRTDPAFVTRWVAARTDRISGVSLREAVRHLPAADRERLLDAYRRRVRATR